MKKKIVRLIKYPIFLLFLLPFIIICMILPYNLTSAFGGIIGQGIGSLIKSRNKIAAKNLQVIEPGISHDKMRKIIKKSWDNFGRIAAELIGLRIRKKTYIKKLIDINGLGIVKSAIIQNRPIIFISAHYSNWEIPALFIKYILKLPLTIVYKKSPSPPLNSLISFLRGSKNSSISNTDSIKRLINVVKERKCLGMIVDQKVIDGTVVPFFGIDSATSTLAQNLTIRYNCIIIPVKISRMEVRHKFKLEFLPHIACHRTGDDKEDIRNITIAINQEFEKWIKADPGEWFLCHRRWPSLY